MTDIHGRGKVKEITIEAVITRNGVAEPKVLVGHYKAGPLGWLSAKLKTLLKGSIK